MKDWEEESASELAHWVCDHAEGPELTRASTLDRAQAEGSLSPLCLCCLSANPKNLRAPYPRAYPEHLPAPRDKLAWTVQAENQTRGSRRGCSAL